MANECCVTENKRIMILPCSGGSNVGQLANQVAVELTKQGAGKMFCLAGIGAHLTGFVQSAKDVPEILGIDGCDIGCVRALLEHVGIPLQRYLVVTGLGISKSHDFHSIEQDLMKVKEACEEVIRGYEKLLRPR